MGKKDSQQTRRQLRNSYLTTVISIALVLFLLGAVGYLMLNAQRLSNYVKENIGFNIVLKDNVRDAEVRRLQKYLDASSYVKSTEYIDKERAAEELKKQLGEDFVDFLGYNPLLSSIEVKLFAEFANPDSIKKVEEVFVSFPQVKEVFYQKNLIQKVNDNVNKISFVLLGFSALLLLIAIALINNTIRLSVYSKRFLINTMQLVGATKGFIRQPFISTSLLHGFIGAVLANGLLAGGVYILHRELGGFIGFDNIELIGILFVIVIVIGMLLSFVSTFFAVNKYLRLKTDQLYF
ncbi:cell division protein FtsX [Plebeiibacterium sediminum]|uniref:Cell division protein FtsX n=1 Tax=Plebeiibacterium sediminum TaxID=2992112 RepID=A0AAE3SIC5_9BACT|nr:permease-like cell division protein FtsX [Plebeiobacterium sediminum]MCW3789078.1 permease-like cell division protein FtsX [Plebeiobacterium sediminum]